MELTRSDILMRPSRWESFLMLRWWNWMRSDQGWVPAGSRRCLILSLYTSRANTLCGVSAMSFSQRWEPMKPPNINFPKTLPFDLVSLAFLCYFLLWKERDIKFEQKYLFTPDFNRDRLLKTNRPYLRWVKWYFSNHGWVKWFLPKLQVVYV